jgi:hypothetical protein
MCFTLEVHALIPNRKSELNLRHHFQAGLYGPHQYDAAGAISFGERPLSHGPFFFTQAIMAPVLWVAVTNSFKLRYSHGPATENCRVRRSSTPGLPPVS